MIGRDPGPPPRKEVLYNYFIILLILKRNRQILEWSSGETRSRGIMDEPTVRKLEKWAKELQTGDCTPDCQQLECEADIWFAQVILRAEVKKEIGKWS